MKFSECVKSMIASCIEDKDIDDLSFVWKMLKNILTDYSRLKKEET